VCKDSEDIEGKGLRRVAFDKGEDNFEDIRTCCCLLGPRPAGAQRVRSGGRLRGRAHSGRPTRSRLTGHAHRVCRQTSRVIHQNDRQAWSSTWLFFGEGWDGEHDWVRGLRSRHV
jgi:hypothetical protein